MSPSGPWIVWSGVPKVLLTESFVDRPATIVAICFCSIGLPTFRFAHPGASHTSATDASDTAVEALEALEALMIALLT
jgi:hypothetical protein